MLHDGQTYDILPCIIRWKCVACGASFRHLPKFCCCFKRYLPGDILEILSRYLEEDSCSYRRAARHRGLPIPHAGEVAEADSSEEQKQAESTPYFSHTTIYRWLTYFAGLDDYFRKLRERVLRQIDRLEFKSFTVAPHKYRSHARKLILVRCRQLIFCLGISQKYTPDFATLCMPP